MALHQVILAASLFQATYFLFNVRRPVGVLRTVSKSGATAFLAILTTRGNGGALLPLALMLGSLGDYFLAGSDTNENFLRGLGSFLLAHVLYIKILLDNSSGRELLFSDSSRLAILVIFALLAPGLNYLILLRVTPDLRIPIAGYSAAIFGMLVAALCVEETRVTSGAVLFTLSDSLLATDRFLLPKGSKHAVWMQYGVWVFYYTGQLLLALGLSS